jgi:hypothetical protein
MKLKTILLLKKESAGFGTHGGQTGGVLTSKNSELIPMPGSMDDIESWNGIIEGSGWFCYCETNNWNTRRSKISVYIIEGELKKYQIYIKTHRLKKPNDTNESYRQRVKNYINRIAKSWISAAKKIHNNPEINEVGNKILVTWSESFKRALETPKIKPFIYNWSECQIKPTHSKLTSVISDPVNFTPRI